ncbi:MAG: ATP synthase F1 subunit gamma [Clostridia bacterium]|nr:ATP synthase F1 subunit gamma [Clostridia bacterium]
MATASMNDIKARMKSVKSTMQITKAMELVATSKLRKAKERAEGTRPYNAALRDAITAIRQYSSVADSVFAENRPDPLTLYVVVAGDRGLAGGFNNNVFRLEQKLSAGGRSIYLPVGKKAIEYYEHRGADILTRKYKNLQNLGVSSALEIGKTVSDLFLEGKVDRVEIVFTDFVSMLSQVPESRTLLPLSPMTQIENRRKDGDPIYEGDPVEMLRHIVPDYLGGSIYVAFCESFASECGARRTAMNSANKNAQEMIDDLTLRYNRARQAVITQEITEIVSGAEAL